MEENIAHFRIFLYTFVNMRIGIDTLGCEHGKSGLGSYLMSFINNIPTKNESDFELFGHDIDRYTFGMGRDFPFSGISVKDSIGRLRLWHYFFANSFAKKRNYDAVFYTAAANMIPLRCKVPGIALVDDDADSIFSGESRWIEKKIKKGLSNADCIIAPSLFVKKSLEDAGVKCKRIEVVHIGIDRSSFYPVDSLGIESDVADIKPFAIKKPYIIYASRMNGSEKKHIELVRAFTLFKKRTNLPHRLVIAGSGGSYSEKVHKEAFESTAASDIFITGYFPLESFPELYRNAEALVYPAVNEGTGLPVLEAMATGIPVACAKAGALTEIAGNNALFFDSDNIENFADNIEKIILDTSLRQSLSSSALEWVKQFSWEKCASETVEIIKDVLNLS